MQLWMVMSTWLTCIFPIYYGYSSYNFTLTKCNIKWNKKKSVLFVLFSVHSTVYWAENRWIQSIHVEKEMFISSYVRMYVTEGSVVKMSTPTTSVWRWMWQYDLWSYFKLFHSILSKKIVLEAALLHSLVWSTLYILQINRYLNCVRKRKHIERICCFSDGETFQVFWGIRHL